MKEVKLTEAEIKILCDMCQNAVKNANTVNPKPYEPTTTEQYRTLCTLYNKIVEKY